MLRDLRAARGHAAAQADWRWPSRATAARFRRQFEIFLRLHGWRVLSSHVGARERVEVTARRDRWCIALLCVGPGQEPAGLEDVRRLVSLRDAIGASQAAIVSGSGPPAVSPGPMDDPHILRLRFDDLARLETALGLPV